MFVALRKIWGEGAAFLNVDYSFDDVEDPIIMGRQQELPADFMDAFQFSLKPGKLEDCLYNGVGWYVLSPRVLDVLKTAAENSEDLIIVPLPIRVQKQYPKLTNYASFGVRRELECLDTQQSDVRWLEGTPRKVVVDIFDGVLAADKVPRECGVFLLKEWPSVPIIRDFIACQLQELKVTGFSFQPFRVSGR
jgi:hypothetical protein